MTFNPASTQIVPTSDRVVLALSDTDFQALNSLLYELENTPHDLDELFLREHLVVARNEASKLRTLWSRLNGIPVRSHSM